jgi:hypothetical protein
MEYYGLAMANIFNYGFATCDCISERYREPLESVKVSILGAKIEKNNVWTN